MIVDSTSRRYHSIILNMVSYFWFCCYRLCCYLEVYLFGRALLQSLQEKSHYNNLGDDVVNRKYPLMSTPAKWTSDRPCLRQSVRPFDQYIHCWISIDNSSRLSGRLSQLFCSCWHHRVRACRTGHEVRCRIKLVHEVGESSLELIGIVGPKCYCPFDDASMSTFERCNVRNCCGANLLSRLL